MLIKKAKFQNLIVLFVALILGLFGGNLIFSGFAPRETPAARIVLIIFHYFLSGFVVGYLFPKRYKYSLFIAWFPVVIGLMIVIGGVGKSPVDFLVGSALFIPLYISLFSALFATRIRSNFTKLLHKR